MERTLKTTEDGSKTLYLADWNESYHSTHGALSEARHVFIENGFRKVTGPSVRILELGFGTGLNTLVTLESFLQQDSIENIEYFTLEKYPLTAEEAAAMQYEKLFDSAEIQAAVKCIHETPWEVAEEIKPGFILTKIEADFFNLSQLKLSAIDLVYFDCFGARVQPDLWEMPLLRQVADCLKSGGLFTTYSSKGSLRRSLQELGFEVEKIPGPKGKREMINAWKK